MDGTHGHRDSFSSQMGISSLWEMMMFQGLPEGLLLKSTITYGGRRLFVVEDRVEKGVCVSLYERLVCQPALRSTSLNE